MSDARQGEGRGCEHENGEEEDLPPLKYGISRPPAARRDGPLAAAGGFPSASLGPVEAAAGSSARR